MSHQLPETVKDPGLLPNKPPDPWPRVWPQLTITQRQQLARQLASLIQRYRQVPLKEDTHDHP
jgi:hypothetical protein